ncbi:unnamed protein product [Oncorhynchus mykiss]|uniref:HAT C-terminal dimerisation domain-containing protein n=1 Tax=Oncorhynchus mykiss TaxID=8022 RepID=A0A060WKG7_ONCMY|nr:unnamed protein product [Oncorhynchus mykiss]
MFTMHVRRLTLDSKRSKSGSERINYRLAQESRYRKLSFQRRVDRQICLYPSCSECSETVALIKSANVKRHYKIKHRSFEQTHPQQSEVWARKINKLQAQCDRSTRVNKKIKQIPMSRTTTARKSEILAEDVLTLRDEAIRSAPCRALAVDEPTDVSDNAQLLIFYHTEKKEFCEDLLDITSHLNELNWKLEVFKKDVQGDCAHFPKAQEQLQGERDVSPHVDFIDKLIRNFRNLFDSFSLGQQHLLQIENIFLITDVTGFSKEVTQTFNKCCTKREHFQLTDQDTFWLQAVSETVFPGLTKVALHTLNMFGSTYSCESSVSTMNIITNKYRSRLTNEHLHMCMTMALTSIHSNYWQGKQKPISLTKEERWRSEVGESRRDTY